jgi:septum formation protein
MKPSPERQRPLILASSSAYRKALLDKLGLAYRTTSPNIDETPKPGEAPETQASRLAADKARALAGRYPDHLIIGSDQVAVANGQRLGKPGSRDNAIAQLRASSGHSVTFYTAICVLDSSSGMAKSDLDRTFVQFRKLSDQQIEHYVDREQPLDCAGSFKSEGLGIALFERIEGEDPNALIGLPLIRLIRLLEEFGLEVL